ncbi:TetR/AcrR family transcriptional regulator [Fictibacillus gelatini]|uniref:TetR/AcrR family transcriptional regulator n=1 Tax=Fictibacillus gelatini TaxID=225985 RepID=UPI000420141B|nr:TetR/AcrR family transcriptional regulator [Fictibacillus gelatini]HWO96851.1 TetR/AcrR family transcriptional regulator [Bacillus sp. (in: firmicutes)]
MSAKKENTADKILSSTVDLMSEKGYKAVTIKEIAAAASVSEMTVFRTFGSKKAILEAVIDNYLYSVPIEQIIQKNLTYELETDLLMISKLYHEVLKKNKKIYLISVMERKTMPEIHLGVHNNASKFFKIVTDYLQVMQQKGKVVKGNPKNQALTIMKYNYGKFVASTLLEGIVPDVVDDGLEEAVSIIARGLRT